MRALVPALLATAMVAVPAHAAVRDWPLRGFERIQLEAPAGLTVHTGTGFAIRAEGEPEAIGRLVAEVRGGTLFITMTRKPGWFRSDEKLRIAVTLPRLSGAGVRGVGAIDADRAAAPEVVFAIDGTGSIDVKAIAADKTVLSLKGMGSIDVAGHTRHLDARRSGMGAIDAGRLVARSAVLVSTGMGSLDARVDGPVSIEKSGMGAVAVAGAARCTVKKSGMGSVTCGKG